MSNPPVPPSNAGNSAPHEQPEYGKSENGQAGQPAPQYGQQAPQYGQQAPQYGQQAPQYGQPQYGQQPPQYGQPQYGQQAPQYGQSQYGQSQYGQSYGEGAWPSQQPSSTSSVPQLVNISFWMILAAGLLTLIGIPIAIALLNSPEGTSMVNEALSAQGAEAAGVDAETIVSIAITTVVIVSLIGAGLYALVAFNIRRGKNWARILGTVFAAISLLGLAQMGIGTITILLGIAAIVLLYLPGAAPYFQKNQPFANPYGQAGNPYGR